MSVTEYISMFAEYFVAFINMLKDFFAGFGGGEAEGEGEDAAE